MSFMDNLKSLENLVENLKTISGNVKRNELVALIDAVIEMLTSGVSTLSNVIGIGKPYPPEGLLLTDVTASQVDLEWTAAFLSDAQYVERSDDDGENWSDISGDLASGANSYSDATVSPDTDYQYRIKAYAKMGKPDAKKLVWRHSDYISSAFPEDIISSLTDAFAFIAPGNGKITNVGLYVANTGEDGANPLEIEADVKIAGTSIFNTKPKITKDATDGSSTYESGTGITQPVFNLTTGIRDFAVGDLITIDLNLTRTATPTDEMSGIVVIIDYEEGERQDSDPSNILFVSTPSS